MITNILPQSSLKSYLKYNCVIITSVSNHTSLNRQPPFFNFGLAAMYGPLRKVTAPHGHSPFHRCPRSNMIIKLNTVKWRVVEFPRPHRWSGSDRGFITLTWWFRQRDFSLFYRGPFKKTSSFEIYTQNPKEIDTHALSVMMIGWILTTITSEFRYLRNLRIPRRVACIIKLRYVLNGFCWERFSVV